MDSQLIMKSHNVQPILKTTTLHISVNFLCHIQQMVQNVQNNSPQMKVKTIADNHKLSYIIIPRT